MVLVIAAVATSNGPDNADDLIEYFWYHLFSIYSDYNIIIDYYYCIAPCHIKSIDNGACDGHSGHQQWRRQHRLFLNALNNLHDTWFQFISVITWSLDITIILHHGNTIEQYILSPRLFQSPLSPTPTTGPSSVNKRGSGEFHRLLS